MSQICPTLQDLPCGILPTASPPLYIYSPPRRIPSTTASWFSGAVVAVTGDLLVLVVHRWSSDCRATSSRSQPMAVTSRFATRTARRSSRTTDPRKLVKDSGRQSSATGPQMRPHHPEQTSSQPNERKHVRLQNRGSRRKRSLLVVLPRHP